MIVAALDALHETTEGLTIDFEIRPLTHETVSVEAPEFLAR